MKIDVPYRSERRVRTSRILLARVGGFGVSVAAIAALLVGCGSGGGVSPVSTTGATPTPSATYSGTLTRTDPQMRAVIQKFLSFNAPPVYTVTPQVARTLPSIADAVRGVLQDEGKSTTPEAVGSVLDSTVPGPAGALPIRVYKPAGSGPFPVTVYFHGGGWVIATIDTYDASCRALCNAAQSIVISVEYRKAPENKFPAAHEDAYAAFQYIAANAAQYGGDPSRVAVAGESAGGNLAASTCLLAKQRGGKMPVYQVLVYPVADNDPTRPSFVTNADAVPLSKPAVLYFLNNYLNTSADGDNPLISLVQADVSGLPPATVITDDIDPLMSEGQALAQHLSASGITTRYQNYTGVTHEFFGTGAVVDTAKTAVAYAAAGLKSAFSLQ